VKKRDELSDPNSCLNRADEDEFVFVLLGRDPSGAAAIRAWVSDRVRRGINRLADDQIQSALRMAAAWDRRNSPAGTGADC
jgi:hypothetical protein